MSDEMLMLCPICGNETIEPRAHRWTNCLGDVSYSAKIECENCNLVIETKSINYETEEEAIDAIASVWNTRTTCETCELIPLCSWLFECSICGEHMHRDNARKYSYCPGCGKRIRQAKRR